MHIYLYRAPVHSPTIYWWYTDGSIDWIDEAYPKNVDDIFEESAPATEDPSDEELDVDEDDGYDFFIWSVH